MTEMEKRREAYRKRKYVKGASDFPEGPHLAIIDFGTITIPGDERSRTNPGHGYPESTQTTLTYMYWAIEDREYWEADIAQREKDKYSRRDYVALDNGRRVKVEPVYQIKVS